MMPKSMPLDSIQGVDAGFSDDIMLEQIWSIT
jgi:hypothetical protein